MPLVKPPLATRIHVALLVAWWSFCMNPRRILVPLAWGLAGTVAFAALGYSLGWVLALGPTDVPWWAAPKALAGLYCIVGSIACWRLGRLR